MYFIPVLLSILKVNIYILLLIASSYFIEKITNLKLLVKYFKWSKSKNNADYATTAHTTLYFTVNVIGYIIDLLHGKIVFSLNITLFWIAIMMILVKIFKTLYAKYQAVDVNKQDDDLT